MAFFKTLYNSLKNTEWSWSVLLYMFEMFLIVSDCSVAAFSSHLVVGRHLFSECILLDLPLFRLFTRPEASVYTYMSNCNTVYMYWASYTNSISFICNLSISSRDWSWGNSLDCIYVCVIFWIAYVRVCCWRVITWWDTTLLPEAAYTYSEACWQLCQHNSWQLGLQGRTMKRV